MRQARIFYGENLAGILTETDDGKYVYQYEYLTEKIKALEGPSNHFLNTNQ